MPDLFPDAPPTLIEQVQCVRRELELRQRCYPRWVTIGKMSQVNADRELARMSAVLQTLIDLKNAGIVS